MKRGERDKESHIFNWTERGLNKIGVVKNYWSYEIILCFPLNQQRGVFTYHFPGKEENLSKRKNGEYLNIPVPFVNNNKSNSQIKSFT